MCVNPKMNKKKEAPLGGANIKKKTVRENSGKPIFNNCVVSFSKPG